MSEDRLSRESTREVFEAIVSQLEDPEVARMRRLLLVLGAAVFVVAVAITAVGPLGWHSLLAFLVTFVPGMVMGRRFVGRHFERVRGADRP